MGIRKAYIPAGVCILGLLFTVICRGEPADQSDSTGTNTDQPAVEGQTPRVVHAHRAVHGSIQHLQTIADRLKKRTQDEAGHTSRAAEHIVKALSSLANAVQSEPALPPEAPHAKKAHVPAPYPQNVINELNSIQKRLTAHPSADIQSATTDALSEINNAIGELNQIHQGAEQ